MADLPTVTVVVPTHNRRDVLPATLRSILQQRDVDLEVVVIDDGSTDGTREWLSHVAPHIHVVRHDQSRGVAAAREAGLALASTPYVAFCDDDDVWAPDKLAAQLDALSRTQGARWSCTSSIEFLISGRGATELIHLQPAPTGPDPLRDLLVRNVIPGGGSSVLAETALVRDVGGSHGGLAEDWDLWIRLGLCSPLAAVASPLCGYRLWRSTHRSRSGALRDLEVGIDDVRKRYAAEAKARDVDQVDVGENEHLAKVALKSGMRREASARYLKLAREKPRKVVWGLSALVSPSMTYTMTLRRSSRSIPKRLRGEILTWLAPLVACSDL